MLGHLQRPNSSACLWKIWQGWFERAGKLKRSVAASSPGLLGLRDETWTRTHVDLERKGLVEICQTAGLRLKDLEALDRLSRPDLSHR